MASVKVVDLTPQVRNATVQKANIFLRLFADHVVMVAEPKTPKKTGRLRADVLKQVLGTKGKIEWRKGYAERMETIQFRNYTTPGTNKDFAKNAIAVSLDKVQSIAKAAGIMI